MLDCQLILGKVLDLDRMSIIINRDKEVSEENAKEYFELLKKRESRMPIKYITQSCEFMGIDFFIKEGVLIPRPDTEILVEELLKDINNKKLTYICDVCCGSGAIGISIAKTTDYAKVDCCDISETAEEVTKKNIQLLGLQDRIRFVKSDLLTFAIGEKLQFDVIVSNPPYIKTEVIPTLMKDVKDYEPYIALWGGDDGLHFYRKITEQSMKVLKAGGILAYEIGHDQADEIQEIMLYNGYKNIRVVKDLAGMDRVIVGVKN